MSQSEIRRAALDFLARREHSLLELRRKLQKRFPDASDLIEDALAKLVTEKLQSDARFTESFTHHRINQGFGPIRIRHELHERGIAETLIEQYLDRDDNVWQEHITALWQKRFRAIKPKDYTEQAKQSRFLQYRGFTVSQINALFRK